MWGRARVGSCMAVNSENSRHETRKCIAIDATHSGELRVVLYDSGTPEDTSYCVCTNQHTSAGMEYSAHAFRNLHCSRTFCMHIRESPTSAAPAADSAMSAYEIPTLWSNDAIERGSAASGVRGGWKLRLATAWAGGAVPEFAQPHRLRSGPSRALPCPPDVPGVPPPSALPRTVEAPPL